MVIRQKKSFKIRIKEKVINIILIIKEANERTRKKQEVCRKEVERNAWPAAASGPTDSRSSSDWVDIIIVIISV